MNRDHLIDAAKNRTTGRLDTFTFGYVTDGGTYVIASDPAGNDDNLGHDLVAIFPLPLQGSHVAVLRPTVDPELVRALRAALDKPPFRIVLEFDDDESLQSALDFIGDDNAPVFLGDGPSRVETGTKTFQLWNQFNDAAAFLASQQN